MKIIGKQKKGDMANQYSPSSHMTRAINMEVWEGRIPCPNGHRDKTLLKRIGLLVYWECNICGEKWIIKGWKLPKDTTKHWR